MYADTPTLIGNALPSLNSFSSIDSFLAFFKEARFLSLHHHKQFQKVNEVLCELILKAPEKSFLLSSALDFIEQINQKKVTKEPLTLLSFEFWLNHFSTLNEEEQYLVRGKIMGKYIPRSAYQKLFPVGMGQVFSGTHFVAAHLSPDTDTLIASFWGWADAFAARLAKGQHQWHLPGGPASSPFTDIFQKSLSPHLFDSIAKTSSALYLTAMDLMTQQGVVKKEGHYCVNEIDFKKEAIVLVDEEGYYLGDWHPSDLEITKQVTLAFKACLRWFESNVHTHLISLFAKRHLTLQEFPYFHFSVFEVKVKDFETVLELDHEQKNDLDCFFKEVMKVDKGIEASFSDLAQALQTLAYFKLANFQTAAEQIVKSDLFDSAGALLENRPKIFSQLERLIHQLDDAMHEARSLVERLDVLVQIKHAVRKIPQTFLTLRSDVEEMRKKMKQASFLTVVLSEPDDKLFPVGIVKAEELKQERLGTVSLRDFCNLDEVKMASYLEVISVMDHHKSSLKTTNVPFVVVADVQSCNVLLAEQAFALNDQYSLGGLTLKEIDEQIAAIGIPKNNQERRILQRLLQRRLVADSDSKFFIHPDREFTEYFSFLQAILDDTDLLAKATWRDLECVAQLLNRLKSLSVKQEVEIIEFDLFTKSYDSIGKASRKILAQKDMHSIYKQVYTLREQAVEENLKLCLKGEKSSIFIDTKQQNGCAQVGQSKFFKDNFPFYLSCAKNMQKIWLDKSQKTFALNLDIDLYIHMISTIASAEEVFTNQETPYQHLDELWISVANSQTALSHLNSFLANFSPATKELLTHLELEIFDQTNSEFSQIFKQHYPNISLQFNTKQEKMPLAILRFNAGALNSRKTMITPFLPRLVA